MIGRSENGLTAFEDGPQIIPGMRHAAVVLDSTQLSIYYSRVGDKPERILRSTVDLSTTPWLNWKASAPTEVIKPKMDYEGADLPVLASERGKAKHRVHQLRDPALLVEDSCSYLFYSVAGESGIAVAKFVQH